MSESPALFTAFRHMTRFRCIGAECESSCCYGWRITVDRNHYQRIERALASSPEGRQEFDGKVALVKGPTRTPRTHALIVLQNGGGCGFLGGTGLCTLQQRFGPNILPDTCAVYPRMANRSGTRLELAGMTSCPEVARQLLLAPDAMELDQIDESPFARAYLQNSLDEHPADPYTRYHDELRNLMFDLLSDDGLPLATRLSTVAYFANRTREFLHQGAAELDEQRLLAEVERIQSLPFRLELHRQFRKLTLDTIMPSRIVLTLVSNRAHVSFFRPLIDGVITRYVGAEKVEVDSPAAQEQLVQQLLTAYAEQKRAWESHSERIDGYLMNYAKSYLAQNWFAKSRDLLDHVLPLLVNIALLRFLLLGHPLLAQAAELSEGEQASLLERAVVDVVTRFSRTFQHSPAFSKSLHAGLNDAHVVTLAHALCLAGF